MYTVDSQSYFLIKTMEPVDHRPVLDFSTEGIPEHVLEIFETVARD